jgi:teichuronic acid biosynthesis glycosyltransferase TuaC
MKILVVTNIYPTPDLPALGTFIEQQVKGLREIGCCVDVMLVERARKGMKAYVCLGRHLRQYLAKRQPDIVHVMYGGIMAEIVTRTVKCRPTVVSFCGSDLLGELLSGRLRRLASGLGVHASYTAGRRASGIVVKSRNLERALPRSINREKVRVIPNGVDLDLFKPLDREMCRAKLGWKSGHFHILFPTNGGDPVKRLGLAKAAVNVVSQARLNVQVHELQGISHSEVPVWLNASDVVMLTSLHEGSPNIIKEALACNLPVVSVDVGDVAERISGIIGCYLASPEPRDLAAKLLLVRSDHPRTKGRDAMQNLSLQNVALQLSDFYSEVMASYHTHSAPPCRKMTDLMKLVDQFTGITSR